MRPQGHHKGFTLVEVLIVIVIIGLLAGSLLLIMGTARDNAEAARIISEMRTMKSAAVLYKSDYGAWPKWVYSGAYIDIEGNSLPDAYTDRLPQNEDYWIGVMHVPDSASEDHAFIVVDGSGLRKGVKEVLASRAQEMRFFSTSTMDYSDLHVFTAEDDRFLWFLTGF
jgi:general secretion pathway protein G